MAGRAWDEMITAAPCRTWRGQRRFEGAAGSDNLEPAPLCAPVAQLDRANASGALGREFESLRARHTHLELLLGRDPSTRSARSGFRQQAPASLTPAKRLKFESLRARHLINLTPGKSTPTCFKQFVARRFRENSRIDPRKYHYPPPFDNSLTFSRSKGPVGVLCIFAGSFNQG